MADEMSQIFAGLRVVLGWRKKIEVFGRAWAQEYLTRWGPGTEIGPERSLGRKERCIDIPLTSGFVAFALFCSVQDGSSQEALGLAMGSQPTWIPHVVAILMADLTADSSSGTPGAAHEPQK
jgi:hypothetical protein